MLFGVAKAQIAGRLPVFRYVEKFTDLLRIEYRNPADTYIQRAGNKPERVDCRDCRVEQRLRHGLSAKTAAFDRRKVGEEGKMHGGFPEAGKLEGVICTPPLIFIDLSSFVFRLFKAADNRLTMGRRVHPDDAPRAAIPNRRREINRRLDCRHCVGFNWIGAKVTNVSPPPQCLDELQIVIRGEFHARVIAAPPLFARQMR